MRLTLLFICLFSVLGGCAASSSHGVVVPKLVRYSEKQQSVVNPTASTQLAFLTADEIAGRFAADDMEEDDDRGYLSLKKYHQANTAFAFAQLVSLSRLHNYCFPDAPVRASTSRKYITHRTLRV